MFLKVPRNPRKPDHKICRLYSNMGTINIIVLQADFLKLGTFTRVAFLNIMYKIFKVPIVTMVESI